MKLLLHKGAIISLVVDAPLVLPKLLLAVAETAKWCLETPIVIVVTKKCKIYFQYAFLANGILIDLAYSPSSTRTNTLWVKYIFLNKWNQCLKMFEISFFNKWNHSFRKLVKQSKSFLWNTEIILYFSESDFKDNWNI